MSVANSFFSCFTYRKIEAEIALRKDDACDSITFSATLDATKLCPVLERSTAFECVFGGVHPFHKIDTSKLGEHEVKKILKGKLNKKDIPLASEIKVVTLSFQHSPKGIPPFAVIAARP